MATESGIIGEVARVSWNSPVITYTLSGDDEEYHVNENDTFFVLRNGVFERLYAVDLIQYDRIIDIVPAETLKPGPGLFEGVV